MPRSVREGEDVISGCINTSGTLRIRTTREFGESTASRILDLVENASSRKSRQENFITVLTQNLNNQIFQRFAVPTIVITALSEVIYAIKLCDCFGKGIGYKIGTILFTEVFLMIFAYGKAKFKRPDKH